MKCVKDWAKPVLALALSATLCGTAAHAEKVAAMPQPTGYVDDYAGVLSAPAKAEIEAECRELHDKTKAQVFFVTIQTLDGEAVETFANELFAKWKIGEKKTDRGVLLLLSVKDHKRWIEIGYGLEGILPDGKVGDIGREMVPALQASNYDEAARIGVRDVSAVIAADAGVTLGGAKPLNQEAPPAPEGIGRSSAAQGSLILVPFLFFGIFGLFFLFVFGMIVWGAVRNRQRGIGGGPYYVPGPGIGYVPGPGSSFGGNTSGSSYSGGDSGGSSFGGGDSGSSFSGGDGGSSGGGGAGGDW